MESKQMLLQWSREQCERLYDPEKKMVVIPRETVWYAITLFEERSPESIAFANDLIENLPDSDGTHTPASLIVVWHLYSELLTEAAKQRIRRYLDKCMLEAVLTRYDAGNVNHPLGAYVTLACGGPLLGNDLAGQIGQRYLEILAWWARGLRSQHHRVATFAEYNSPTYSATDLWFLNILASFCPHKETAALAQELEEAMWIEVAAYYHHGSNQLCGPHSRAYQEGSTGGMNMILATLWHASGEPIYLNPELDLLFEHESDLIGLALPAVLDFNFPKVARELAFAKRQPFLIQQVTYCQQYHENSTIEEDGERVYVPDDEIYAGGWGDMTCYMTEEYALGTASRQYVNGGHNDTFTIRLRRAEQVQSMADFRNIYTRGVYNHAVVGQDNHCHLVGKEISKTFLYEEGRDGIFQHRNKAIVCYFPKRAGHLGVEQARLDIIMGHFAPLDELVVGDQLVEAYPYDFDWTEPVCFRDFRTYVAFIPLQPVCVGREKPGSIWEANDHLMISIFNYEGPPQDFTRDQMSRMNNGFVCELSDADHFPSLAEFAAHIRANQVVEETSPGGIRTLSYRSDGEEMRFVYDPLRDLVISRQVEGEEMQLEHVYMEVAGKTTGPQCLETIY